MERILLVNRRRRAQVFRQRVYKHGENCGLHGGNRGENDFGLEDPLERSAVSYSQGDLWTYFEGVGKTGSQDGGGKQQNYRQVVRSLIFRYQYLE